MNRKAPVESARKLLRSYGGAIGAAIFIALIIRFFVIEAYRIPSTAMKPTLEPGDTIFVSKLDYGFWTTRKLPGYGEVLVFSFPEHPDVDYIKRVVALPGDRVAVQGGQVILNGKVIFKPSKTNAACGEETLPGTTYSVCREPPLIHDMAELPVPQGFVFVIGDQRSRPPGGVFAGKGWGMVPLENIKGKALWVWLSVEPRGFAGETGLFSRIRFERMFRRIQ